MNTTPLASALHLPSTNAFYPSSAYPPSRSYHNASTETYAEDNDCILEIFLSPFQQGRLPNSFWYLCQPTTSDARWVTWLYPSSQMQSRLLRSRSESQYGNPMFHTIDSFRMVRSQEAKARKNLAALMQAITLATSRVVIIESHHLTEVDARSEKKQPCYLSQQEYAQLNQACFKNNCQLVILHSMMH